LPKQKRSFRPEKRAEIADFKSKWQRTITCAHLVCKKACVIFSTVSIGSISISMALHDLLRFAFQNLLRAKLRNTLTIIGVGVGTAALVSMLSYGSGLQKTFTDEFSDLELFNTVRISPTSNEFASLVNFSNRIFKGEKKKETNLVVLTPEVLKRVKLLAADVAPGSIVYPEIIFPCRLSLDTLDTPVLAEALPATMRNITGYNQIRYGSFFESDSSKEVVVSEILLNRLGVKNPQDALGKTITLTTVALDFKKIMAMASGFGVGGGLPIAERKYQFRIGGIMDKEIQKLSSGLRLIMPIATAEGLERLNFISTIDLLRRTEQREGYQAIVVRVRNPNEAEVVKDALQKIKLNATSFADEFEEFKRLFILFDMALAVVGTIALVVATLGITNTMIMSIMERYREIGIMKAVGANDSDVRRIILVESAVIGFFGGMLGLLLGKLGTMGVNALANYYVQKQAGTELAFFYFPSWLVISAIVFSILISMLAGLYPANRAARIEPVEALKYQ
jgi:putative ABC transport system permease protein